ncbi:MAG: hypothetical protein HeimC3_37220 [Candidatus Heimdallarchaeota archaeon LC_3]|nr:MAG: hypothetical protein HeimC3_37220 [Candidatus Heimdallarchaeota archaeon LC_3]
MTNKRVPISDIEALIESLNKTIYNKYLEFMDLNKDIYWDEKLKKHKLSHKLFIETFLKLKPLLKRDLDNILELQECLDKGDPETSFSKEKINLYYRKIKNIIDSNSMLILKPNLEFFFSMKKREIESYFRKLESDFSLQIEKLLQENPLYEREEEIRNRITWNTVNLITLKRPYKISIQLNVNELPFYKSFKNPKEIGTYLRKVQIKYQKLRLGSLERSLKEIYQNQRIFLLFLNYNFLTFYLVDITLFGKTKSDIKRSSFSRTNITSKEGILDLISWLKTEKNLFSSLDKRLAMNFKEKRDHFLFYALFPE